MSKIIQLSTLYLIRVVPFTESFSHVIDDSFLCDHTQHFFFLLAYYNDIVVGAVCCRIDQTEDARRLYIMTLGCLAPYRRLGIGRWIEKQLNLLFANILREACRCAPTVYSIQRR